MSALGEIAHRVAAAMKPLEAALADPGAFRAFMLRLGWRASAIPPEWMALANHVASLEAAVTALADDPAFNDVVTALASVNDLRAQLAGLTSAI
jgi:hypothetical protein